MQWKILDNFIQFLYIFYQLDQIFKIYFLYVVSKKYIKTLMLDVINYASE